MVLIVKYKSLNEWSLSHAGVWKRKLEAVKAVKFLWKRKHFE